MLYDSFLFDFVPVRPIFDLPGLAYITPMKHLFVGSVEPDASSDHKQMHLLRNQAKFC